ncbi:DoxX family protein [Taibaiella helva]|uniref:DoxX family protein n=1 Tax=Taibaiella helva TaxID=2301235 RepID=UPI002936EB9E|nr:DoxX family protein [Taibaiella helva]
MVLSFKHGWDTFHYKSNPQSLKMMNELGISEGMIPVMGVLTILTGILLLFPRTFFWGNVLNALSIVLIMALALRASNVNMVILEIPFLVIPLVVIWLKYPFKN